MSEFKRVKLEGDRIKARLGEPVTFDLPSRGTAGYDWVVNTPDETALVSRKLYRAPMRRTLGSANVVTILVEPLALGDHHLELVLKRPFEDEVLERRDVTVSVRPGSGSSKWAKMPGYRRRLKAAGLKQPA